jgi:BirA family biotin operon repressor/biotin-[acetyl-CoA-carboxylase] ligase
MARAQQESVDGVVYTAELQVQGRGRRGRSWSSPFGANLAISLGVAVAVTPARLGGVSLVVGLAVVEALEQLQVSGLALKWPNDVLLGGDKLGGILIEMTQARGGTELVVGIGLNVALPETVRAILPPGIADLAGAGVTAPRSVVAARVISAVVEFVGEFARQGFEPFLAPFNARHAFHGKECTVLMGERRIAGRVAGVTQSGELILLTADGPRTFHGGEVSLRQSL